MAWKWYDSKIIEIRDLTPNTKLFVLKVTSDEILNFEAGQFITLDLPIGEKRRDGWRSYSIANEPNSLNIIELCIVNLEGGLGTDYLFNKANVGTILKFKGPAGNFCLPENKPPKAVLICTGTGITPFRSMWRDEFKQGITKNNIDIHIIFGTRKKEDILFEEEMAELAKNHSNFTYDICLSREEIEGYSHGYVHQVYLEKYKDQHEGCRFYICGWSKMVDQAVQHLILDLKIDRKEVIYELFG